MKYFAVVLLVLSGCATSEYGRGCRDALENTNTGEYTEWQGALCDKLEKKRNQERRDMEAHQYGRGK